MRCPPESAFTVRADFAEKGLTPPSPQPADVLGLWTFHIGRFGCLDSEMHRGVMHFSDGNRVFGGDSHFTFTGSWTLDTELRATLHISRHRPATDCAEILGSAVEEFTLTFTAEAMSADHFEGHSHREGYPEFRAAIRRAA